MIQRQEIVDVATAFAGRALTAGEAEVLSSLCGGALAGLLGARPKKKRRK